MDRRYFPVTAMAGRLFAHSAGYQPEEAVDAILKMSPPGDRKVHTADELRAALGESAGRLSAITLWVVEGMEDYVQEGGEPV